jgi:hypothetical protein
MSDMSDNTLFWTFQDTSFYEFLKNKYKDRAKLHKEAEDKRKAAEKVPDTSPLYQRAQVSAEMASLRLDMAYIIERNNNLEEMLGTVEYLHQKVGILEGAYGHLKLLNETAIMQTAILNRKPKEPAKCPEPSSSPIKSNSSE